MKQGYPDGYSGPEPKLVRDYLIRRGGETPAGYPKYRMVLSSQVFEKKAGTWCDWDSSIAPEDRGRISPIVGADGKPFVSNRPTRVVKEMREIPRYTEWECQGWIIERWFPPSSYDRSTWYDRVVEGTSLPLLGPFPEEGRYDLLCGPFEEVPSLSFVEQQLDYWARRSEEMLAEDVATYVRRKTQEAEEREAKRVEEAQTSSELILRDGMSFLNGTSLAAGRLRNQAAERAGIRSHMGN
ncbi:MAG: hypothetical protein ACLQLH_03510 [Terracidiphilus sp.]